VNTSSVWNFRKSPFRYGFSWKATVFSRYSAIGMKIHEQDAFFMRNGLQNDFSGPVTVFQDRRLPELATPVGYAALIDALRLRAPAPRTLSAIGARHKLYQQDGWNIYTPRHAPRRLSKGI
jgi:hypothetical protein